MKVFTKRPFALLLSALVILGSTAFGVHRSLSPVVSSTANGFYDGVYSERDGYTTMSIYSQLDAMTDAAMGLITKCGGYESETDRLRASRSELLDAMESHDVSDMYDAYKSLCKSGGDLADAIAGTELETDAAVADYLSVFAGAQSVISASGYNASVRSLESETLDVFPTNLFSALLNIEAPELFE